MSWTLVRTPDDWKKYKLTAADTLRVQVTQVSWGDGPQQYPALVCTHMPPRPPGTDPKLYSAYVYPGDAEELLKAAGVKFQDPDAPVPPNQAQFNRWVAAGWLAVVRAMVKTGLFAPKGGEPANEKAYEDALLECLCLVDDYQGDRKEQLKAQLSKYETTVLDTLQPPG